MFYVAILSAILALLSFPQSIIFFVFFISRFHICDSKKICTTQWYLYVLYWIVWYFINFAERHSNRSTDINVMRISSHSACCICQSIYLSYKMPHQLLWLAFRVDGGLVRCPTTASIVCTPVSVLGTAEKNRRCARVKKGTRLTLAGGFHRKSFLTTQQTPTWPRYCDAVGIASVVGCSATGTSFPVGATLAR